MKDFDHIVIPGQPIRLDRSKTTAEYFDEGNFTTAAMLGRDEEWQKWAAYALIGLPEKALGGLLQFKEEEHIRFYQGVACFMMRADKEALTLFETVPAAHARNMVALLRKPQINVLTMLPWDQQPSLSLRLYAHMDYRFNIMNIGRDSRDLPETPYMNVLDYVSEATPPDFFLAMMIEFHHLPIDLQALECPILGHTADFDIHYHCVKPVLNLFDELIVNDGTEFQHLSALTDRPVTTMPKSFGLPTNLEPVPQTARSIDIAQTGTLFHPYHYDKAKYVIELLKSHETNGQFINSFQSPENYFKLLGRSKLTLVYARHGGCTPTRGVEALSMGCIPLVHQDNCLQLFVSEREGLATYDYDNTSVLEKAQDIIHNWSRYGNRAVHGAYAMREQFNLPLVVSQYLRYATVLAARPRKKARIVASPQQVQRRPILYKGWAPSSALLRPHFQVTHHRLRALQKSDRSGEFLNLTLREVAFLLQVQDLGIGDAQVPPGALSQLFLECYEKLPLFPQALVLRFNLIRVACYQGTPHEVTRALELLDTVLSSPMSAWTVSTADDVFAWDYAPETFNYRSYLDHATLVDSGNLEAREALARLLYASMHHIRGAYAGDVEDHRTATRLDPDFPYYRLALADALICRNHEHRDDDSSLQEAARLLEALAECSSVATLATTRLNELSLLQHYHSPILPELHRRYANADRKLAHTTVRTLFPLMRCLHRRTQGS